MSRMKWARFMWDDPMFRTPQHIREHKRLHGRRPGRVTLEDRQRARRRMVLRRAERAWGEAFVAAVRAREMEVVGE